MAAIPAMITLPWTLTAVLYLLGCWVMKWALPDDAEIGLRGISKREAKVARGIVIVLWPVIAMLVILRMAVGHR